MLILNLKGSAHVQAVVLDDPSPEYVQVYVEAVRRFLPQEAELRWAEVDVSRVSEHGPDEIAAALRGELGTDLPQTWNDVGYAGPR